MKFLIAISLCIAVVLIAGTLTAQSASATRHCVICGKELGNQCPESVLSRDPDFKAHRMFQTCQTCLNRRMSKRAQANYVQVAFKYKWNSIAHNLSEAVKVRTQ